MFHVSVSSECHQYVWIFELSYTKHPGNKLFSVPLKWTEKIPFNYSWNHLQRASHVRLDWTTQILHLKIVEGGQTWTLYPLQKFHKDPHSQHYTHRIPSENGDLHSVTSNESLIFLLTIVCGSKTRWIQVDWNLWHIKATRRFTAISLKLGTQLGFLWCLVLADTTFIKGTKKGSNMKIATM